MTHTLGRLALAAWASLALAGGKKSGEAPDAAAAGADATAVRADAAQADAAQGGADAELEGADAQVAGVDASQPGRDAATPGRDASSPGTDAGPVAADASTFVPDTGAALFQLTVGQGYVSGSYPAGATVNVWAAIDPAQQIVTAWGGADVALLKEPSEWHTTLTMPARNVAVQAAIAAHPLSLLTLTNKLATTVAKTTYYYLPPNPKGVLFILHGTGGSSESIKKTEALYIAMVAVANGYGVVAPEAEEAVAGDLNGDGKTRWDVGPSLQNLDFANLENLVVKLRNQGSMSSSTPLLVLGMSNGGSMAIALGTLATSSSLSAAFPSLRFNAVISHCANGTAAYASATTTPTGWLMCGRDDNPEVSNADAKANHDAVAARGIDTVYDEHQPSPLHDERFLRCGMDLATSKALAAELRGTGDVDAAGYVARATGDISADLQANPAKYPVLSALPSATQKLVQGQLSVLAAEHELYSDWAQRAVDFFDTHVP